MDFNGFYEDFGAPFTGRKRRKLQDFLQKAQLDYDEEIEYTVNLVDGDGAIVATGSIHQNVLKCIAVDKSKQGLGLSARVVTLLLNYAMERGREHLFLFTKPKNRQMFGDLGFYPITQTADVLLMENRRDGIQNYVRSLQRPEGCENIGAIVANCNPFTLGHRYLIEQAAAQCDALHLFVLSEDRSQFPAEVRYRLVEEGIAGIPNVYLHPTSDYLISSAVFPTYFIKDKAKAADANCQLDIQIFGEFFAKELHITKRFVGTEPFCPVTSAYNKALMEQLPRYGVELIQLPRLELGGQAVSASEVRRLLALGDYDALKGLVPESTYRFLLSPQGQEIGEKLRAESHD